jgi:hypothetical protein
MEFEFESFHFAMDSREKIQAMKNLRFLPAELMTIVVEELKNQNVISRVQQLGENEIEVLFRDAFHQSYECPGIQHTLENDPHYRGDFYRASGHAVVAALKSQPR